VLLYVQNCLSSTMAQMKTESVWCNIHVDKAKSLMVGGSYKSEQITDNEIDNLNLTIQMASLHNKY